MAEHYPPYWVARWKHGRQEWVTFADEPTDSDRLRPYGSRVEGWYYEDEFDDLDTAILCAQAIRRAVPSFCALAVVNEDDHVVWKEAPGTVYGALTGGASPTTASPQEDKMEQQNLAAPLHIPRESLIEALQEKLDAEVAKREEAAAKKAENTQRVMAAIKTFTDDELMNLIASWVSVSSALDFEQWVEKAKEDKRYVSKEVAVTPKENTLERTVRALNLASDKEIEVQPTDPIYDLL